MVNTLPIFQAFHLTAHICQMQWIFHLGEPLRHILKNVTDH